jgi:Na+/pantothenate symporter
MLQLLQNQTNPIDPVEVIHLSLNSFFGIVSIFFSIIVFCLYFGFKKSNLVTKVTIFMIASSLVLTVLNFIYQLYWFFFIEYYSNLITTEIEKQLSHAIFVFLRITRHGFIIFF